MSIDKISLDLSPDFLAVEKPKSLLMEVVGDKISISWFGIRQLQSRSTLNNDWTDIEGTTGVQSITLPVSKTATATLGLLRRRR